jgi:hypothetical protein
MSQAGPYDLVSQIGDIVQLPSTLPVHVRPGQTVPCFCSVYQLGVLADPTTVTFSLRDPYGNITSGAVTRDSTGNYECDMPIGLTANPGVWVSTWETSGQAYEGATNQVAFYVDALMTVPVPSGCPPTSSSTTAPTTGPGSGEILLLLGGQATQTSQTSIPAGAFVTSVKLEVDSAYGAGVGLSVGNANGLSLIMTTAQNDPQAPGTYTLPQNTSWGSTALPVVVTVTGGPTSGSGSVAVQYTTPGS